MRNQSIVRSTVIAAWNIAPPPDIAAIPPDLLALVGGQPIAATALLLRGLTDVQRAAAYLDPSLYQPAAATELPDLVVGAELLLEALHSGQSVLIWGDFDADGQTSTALLTDALRPLFGSGKLHWHIPDRLRDGHGIQPESLAMLLDRYQPAVLLSCDTGVTAHDAIDLARRRGVRTIITDHHALPATLPHADAVINPQRLVEGHPLRALPGVGTAYKFIEYVYSQCDLSGAAPKLLDLVALGIVADVATLVDDTRYLLQIGLQHLRRAERPGIRALFDTARLEARTLTAEQIGFQLGPRLNAAGRLGDPGRAVELLTTTDPTRAALIAQELEGLNRRRREMQRETEETARQLISADPSLLDGGALVLYRSNWPAGILGPVAGRLAERYQRPTILLTAVDDHHSAAKGEALARGSGRSALGFDLNAALTELEKMLTGFGGHSGAAGLTLPVASIPAFRRALNERFNHYRSAILEASIPLNDQSDLQIEASLPLTEVTSTLANTLARLAPFGEGNPPVVLQATGVSIVSQAFLDRAHLHRRLSVSSSRPSDEQSHSVPVYWWNSGDETVPDEVIDLAYTIDTAPDGSLQFTLIDFRPNEAFGANQIPARQWIDCRQELNPDQALDRLRHEWPHLSIWAEGYSQRESPGTGRDRWQPGAPLVIFTIPPSSTILREVITHLNPPTVFVFGYPPPPPFDNPTASNFMRQLDSIARLVITQQAGQINLSTLVTRLAQPETLIRFALGHLPGVYCQIEADRCQFNLSENPAGDEKEWIAALARQLDESRAYRSYFRRAPIEALGL